MVLSIRTIFFFQKLRNGPSLIGWENLPLPAVCSRISEIRDETFWERNIDECTSMYRRKEGGILVFTRIMLSMVYAYVVVRVIRSLIRARYAFRPDKDMTETYQALHILARQIGRASRR